MKQGLFFLFIVLMFSACGSGDSSGSADATSSKYNIEYKGLTYYALDMLESSYTLTPLSEEEFDNLSSQNKQLVSDKLLATLFFGMTKSQLQKHFDDKDFLTSVQT